MSVNYEYEVRFWSQILGDHMRFIINALDVSELAFLERASILRDNLDDVYMGMGGTDAMMELAIEVKNLKQGIMREQLNGNVKILLPPTFINHMLNEVDECIQILNGNSPSGLQVHKLWLQDAIGHADQLKGQIDIVDKKYRKAMKEFKKKFKNHFMTNEEFMGYVRASPSFPSYDVHNERIHILMNEFIEILEVLHQGRASNEILGSFTKLVPDHMIREESYYLRKLGYDAPDPTMERRE